MSFKLLKEIIAAFRKKSSCPFCESKFNDDSIFVLATNMGGPGGHSNGLFFVVCPKCSAQAFVMMKVTNHNDPSQESLEFETKSAEDISVDEVLDMHNFLKEWHGDVKELFQEL